MIKKCVVLVCLLASANASLHTVTLRWTQSDSPDIVANKVYCSRVPGGPYPYYHKTSSPTTLLRLSRIPSGQYYCMVTAIDSQGMESIASNEVEVDVP